MLTWIKANLATIIICAVLIAVVALIIVSLVKAKRQGKSSCGCESCAMAGKCHSTPDVK